MAEKPGPSGNDMMCQICHAAPSRYTCPRCSARYCSSDCYKSIGHLECSEEFFKQCVEDEMKAGSRDPEQKKKMLEILKKYSHQDLPSPFQYIADVIKEPYDDDDDDDDLEELDSDDDESVADLMQRVKGIDLNDVNKIWAVLTETEHQTFEAAVASANRPRFLPEWRPWWMVDYNYMLVREVNDKPKFVENCPKILDLPHIPEVEKASPSVRYNILNVLASYALTACHYLGEQQETPGEAASLFLELCDNIRDNIVFEEKTAALKAVTFKAREFKLITNRERGVTIEYIKQILRGPDKDHQTYYILAALSDLHELFRGAKKELSKNKGILKKLTKPFRTEIDMSYIKVPTKSIPLYLKKIEYYIAWVKVSGHQMRPYEP